jgi:hypothetical protein
MYLIMFRYSKAFLVVVLLIFCCGCATSYTFREIKASEPHAILNFQREGGTLGIVPAVSPLEINGKEPSKLKMSYRTFRVSPGPIVILAKANIFSTRRTAFDTIKFDVQPGETYLVERQAEDDYVTFTVKNSQEEIIYKNTVKKVKYEDR